MAIDKIRTEHILSSDRTGDGDQLATANTGAKTTGNLASWDASDDLQDSGVASSAVGKVSVAKAGTLVGARGRANFIEGANVTLTIADDAGNDEVDITIASSGGGGAGSNWTKVGEWHHSVSGDTASPIDFTSLGSYEDMLFIARLVSTSVSGNRVLYASVDGGSTFYTSSGDYVDVNSSGVESSVVAWCAHATGTGAARTIIGYGPRAGLDEAPKPMLFGANNTITRWFVASTNDVDAVRFANLGGGNFTGGDVWIYVR